MSAVESEETNGSDANGADDEEEEEGECGDAREEKAEEKTASSTTLKDGEDTQNTGQDDEDSDNESDDDDDICITIGEIKPGGSSQRISPRKTPVKLNIKYEGRTRAVFGTKSKGVGVDAMGNIQGIPVLGMDVESLEDKPWRKPGAVISDYFNYGFNEASWKAYRQKQWRLRARNESMNWSPSKITVQKRHIRHEEKESWCDYRSSGSLHIATSRNSSGTIDVIGGQTGSISRVEGRRRHSNEGNYTQVLSKMSSDDDTIISFLPFNIPPSPLLPPPSNVKSALPLIPPPPVPRPPGVPIPSLIPVLHSGCFRGCDESPIATYSFSPVGVIPGNMASCAGVFDRARAWEFYTRQDRGREHDRSRDRSRERGHNKDRERGRDREREHSPSKTYHSKEAQTRHRDKTERGTNRHRDSRDIEAWFREWMRRHADEGWHQPSHSSSSSSRMRRRDSEEGDRHRRHRHKH